MIHYYQQGKATGKHLLLLHGTGGDEMSLLDIAGLLDEDATILSFRGEVSENGMNRFFKRNGEGNYDYDSLEQETDKLYAEIKKISQVEGVALQDWILVGYSNGANIAAHLLLERHTELTKGMFFHVMSLRRHTQKFPLTDKKIWASFSDNDPIVSHEEFHELVDAFTERGGNVTISENHSGHQLSQEEFDSAVSWLAAL